MADDIDIESIKDATAATNELTAATNESASASTAAGDAMDKGMELAKKAVSSLSDVLKGSAASISAFLGGQAISVQQLEETYEQLKTTALNVNGETQEAVVKTASAFITVLAPELTSSIQMFGKLGDTGVDSGQRISDSFSKLGPLLSKMGIGDGVSKGVAELFRLSEESRGSELSLMKLAAASGSLGSFMDKGVLSTTAMSDAAAAWSERLEQTGNATGRLSTELEVYKQNMKGIPDALDMFISTSEEAGGSTDFFTASIKVADGLFMKHSDVIDFVSKTHIKFGTSVQDSMNNLANFRHAANELKIPMEAMNSYMDQATSGVSSMGDASASAIKLIQSFGKTLGETGASKQAMADITSGMIGSAKDMDMGKASFVSQASGGPGGLAGGFEIELLKQQGDFGAIIDKTMTALQNSGLGAPTTLQDVKENPALAGQLMKQTEMLKEFGLAKNDQEAFRVLAAMKDGGQESLQNALKDMKDPQEQMLNALNIGNKIAEESPNKLISLLNQGNRALATKAGEDRDTLEWLDRKGDNNESYRYANSANNIPVSLSGNLTDANTGIQDVATGSSRVTERGKVADDAVKRGAEMKELADGMIKTVIDTTTEIGGRFISKISGSPKDPMKDDVARAAGTSTAAAGTAGNTQPQNVVIDGKLQVEVDIKDGVATIARKEFGTMWSELESKEKNAPIVGTKL